MVAVLDSWGAPAAHGVEDRGGRLVELRWRLDTGEAEWLEELARFDVERGWEADGQLSCVEWLMAALHMGRATAFDKLRVARQLRARPVLAAAYAAGRVSYCALRAVTRAEGTTVEVDEALVDAAEACSVLEVERLVRSYRLYQSQERRPSERVAPGRGLWIRPLPDGMARLEAVFTDVEAAELDVVLRGLLEQARPAGAPEQSSREDPPGGPGTTGDGDTTTSAAEQLLWTERCADALMELARCGLGEWPGGADRHMVHLVVADGRCRILGGPPVPPGDAARVLCDCSHVTHVESDTGVPLALGRRQRAWSTGQRRAIAVRDGGQCRWPGCQRTRVDVHHLLAWEFGGVTDVANGVTLCPPTTASSIPGT